MKKHHARKWIKALRSGKYKQGTNYLCKDGEYCCLGVLDEIFPEMELNGGSDTTLKNYSKIGLRAADGFIPDSQESLADLNDIGYTFDEIADIIQIEYVEGL
jgi:hypothetical protein